MFNRRNALVSLLIGLLFVAAQPALGADTQPAKSPPGTVVAHVPSATRSYIGSPSIAVLADGTYLVSHDLFGPATTEHVEAMSRIFKSEDRGQTWKQISEIKGAFWSTLFVHKANVYLIGTTAHHGNAVIRRSSDGGATWTTPSDAKSGLLLKGQYHCAPVPVVEHKGRLWRAIEDASSGKEWGKRYGAMMLSIPVDADLLDAGQWTASNFIPRDEKWLGGRFNAWLEGNAVVTPEGKIVNILRVDLRPEGQTAAMVQISDDGKTASFDPASGFIKFPGGAVKFTIRFDPKSKLYWSLTNDVPEAYAGGRAASIRNTVALISSPDLRNWTVRSYILHHPDPVKHGFQYIDWLFEGDAMIAVVRTAYDEPGGSAHNFHDANYLIFKRIENFRDLKMADSIKVQSLGGVTIENADFAIVGRGFTEAMLADGAKAYSNRTYDWQQVPAAFAGATIAQTAGGEPAMIKVTAKRDATLHVATSAGTKGSDLLGFKATEMFFQYTDKGGTKMRLYHKAMKAGETIFVPQSSWTGTIVVLKGEKQ